MNLKHYNGIYIDCLEAEIEFQIQGYKIVSSGTGEYPYVYLFGRNLPFQVINGYWAILYAMATEGLDLSKIEFLSHPHELPVIETLKNLL